ncbi:MAG TPA: 50S ribosomal protein L10, partial [Arthrobacter sp.]
ILKAPAAAAARIIDALRLKLEEENGAPAEAEAPAAEEAPADAPADAAAEAPADAAAPEEN